MEQPLLIVVVGLPGAGKSTYLQRIGANPVSTDALRQQLIDDATDQTIHKQVYAAVRYLVRQRVLLLRPVTYIDATNLTIKDRKQFIRLARVLGCRIQALFFDTPLKVCLERNRKRGRIVPEEVIAMMAAKLVTPSVDEGFESVSFLTP